MTHTTLEQLPAFVEYYIRRVVGLEVELKDGTQPCAYKGTKPHIELPMTHSTLSLFLGPDFVQAAPTELLFSIVIGLAYHEAAHLLSGEPDVEPHLLNNIICDSNDFTFVPARWKGSMPFTLALINTTYAQARDLDAIPLLTRRHQLQALLHLAITYLRKLRIRVGGKDRRRLPDDHPLASVFEEIKPIMRHARRASTEDRPALVQALHTVLKDFWEDTPSASSPRSSGASLEQNLEDMQPDLQSPLPEQAAQQLAQELRQSGALTQAARELNRAIQAVEHTQQADEKKKDQAALNRLHKGAGQGDQIVEVVPDTGHVVSVDRALVQKLRMALKPLLWGRTLARRKPHIAGVRFAPARFHEVKTYPQAPRIRKEALRMGKAQVDTCVVLCFDRSGSMEGKKESICKEIATAFYQALLTLPRAELALLGFDTQVSLIFDGQKRSRDVLKRIYAGLTPRGGTDFTLGMYCALRQAQKSNADKKVVVLLTDGDLRGTYAIDDLLRYARTEQIEVVVMGIPGSDPADLTLQLGRVHVLYVQDVQKLPSALQKTVVQLL